MVSTASDAVEKTERKETHWQEKTPEKAVVTIRRGQLHNELSGPGDFVDSGGSRVPGSRVISLAERKNLKEASFRGKTVHTF